MICLDLDIFRIGLPGDFLISSFLQKEVVVETLLLQKYNFFVVVLDNLLDMSEIICGGNTNRTGLPIL